MKTLTYPLLRSLLGGSLTVLFAAYASAGLAQEVGGTTTYADPVAALAVSNREIPYSDFIEQVQRGKVAAVVIAGDAIRGESKEGARFLTVSPVSDNRALIDELIRNGVKVTGERPSSTVHSLDLVVYTLPTLLLIAVLMYFMRQQQKGASGSGGGATEFGKSRAHALDPGEVKMTFGDVAGVDEAKQEVAELVDFLKDPDKFQRLGGKIPRGVLLVGPPGTGKTLLARAIAGEAGVPFLTISASSFVEMYVGVGASRVRDLFDQAERRAPCIIFIDEIDAVGRHRSAGVGSGHDERDQTLNQLLVRMDGFEGNRGVIVIAATNRPDVLDPALLRPGRFDRQVVVPLPDVRGREAIVRVHARSVPLGEDVDLAQVARGAPGFSGADLANLVNEAALFAARANKSRIGQSDFERAMDKIVMGTERRSFLMSEQDKKLTAYHEAGHTIVGLNVPDHDPVHKVSIVPRGRALGVTLYLPEADRCSYTRESLHSRICALLGGRVAEALVFGEDKVTTGASNDIQRATQIARNMVTQYGMSERMGLLAYADASDGSFLDGGAAQAKLVSNDTARAIDQAVREIVEQNYRRARQILETNLDTLHRMAGALIQNETLTREQIQAILRDRGPERGRTGQIPAGLRECPV